MSAVTDENLHFLDDLVDELNATLDAFEAASGFLVCLRALSDRWDGPNGRTVWAERFEYHRSDFCVAWKERALPACTRCDNNEVLIASTAGGVARHDPFVRTCHAGADEIIVPIWSQNQLVGVLFIGQFVARDGGPPELPALEPERGEHIVNLARPLRFYLLDVFRRLDRIKTLPRAGKRVDIEDYVRETLATGPTLAGLGARLNLSPSRASHLVREATGESFQTLVERQRIGIAVDLLSRTDATIAEIGRRVGFHDAGYFSRYFKLKTGQTPGEHRRRAVRRVTV